MRRALARIDLRLLVASLLIAALFTGCRRTGSVTLPASASFVPQQQVPRPEDPATQGSPSGGGSFISSGDEDECDEPQLVVPPTALPNANITVRYCLPNITRTAVARLYAGEKRAGGDTYLNYGDEDPLGELKLRLPPHVGLAYVVRVFPDVGLTDEPLAESNPIVVCYDPRDYPSEPPRFLAGVPRVNCDCTPEVRPAQASITAPGDAVFEYECLRAGKLSLRLEFFDEGKKVYAANSRKPDAKNGTFTIRLPGLFGAGWYRLTVHDNRAHLEQGLPPAAETEFEIQ